MPGEKHNQLARMGLRFLRAKTTGQGMRGGFDVPLATGYIADAAVLCSLQIRYADRYIGKQNFERISDYETVIPEVLCVFEAKATRADFLSTFGDGPKHENRKTPIGNLHWCVAGRGVARAEEMPGFWGLLEVRGLGLRCLRAPVYQPMEEAAQNAAAYQILWYAKPNHELHRRNLYRLTGDDLE